MIKLLNANFYRLKKNICFWILFVLMGLFGIYIYINYNGTNPASCINCGDNELGSVFFVFLPFICIILPIFICLFIGSEYSDGTIKNKIISGNKRINIYLSNLIISIIVSFIYSIIYIIMAILMGLILENGMTISINKFIFLLFDSLMLNILSASLFTFISMTISNKTTSLTISLAIVIWSILITSNVFAKLSGAVGLLKQFYQTILNIIPYGQAIQIADLSDDYNKFWLFSLVLIIIINFYGLFIINKKELN